MYTYNCYSLIYLYLYTNLMQTFKIYIYIYMHVSLLNYIGKIGKVFSVFIISDIPMDILGESYF